MADSKRRWVKDVVRMGREVNAAVESIPRGVLCRRDALRVAQLAHKWPSVPELAALPSAVRSVALARLCERHAQMGLWLAKLRKAGHAVAEWDALSPAPAVAELALHKPSPARTPLAPLPRGYASANKSRSYASAPSTCRFSSNSISDHTVCGLYTAGGTAVGGYVPFEEAAAPPSPSSASSVISASAGGRAEVHVGSKGAAASVNPPITRATPLRSPTEEEVRRLSFSSLSLGSRMGSSPRGVPPAHCLARAEELQIQIEELQRELTRVCETKPLPYTPSPERRLLAKLLGSSRPSCALPPSLGVSLGSAGVGEVTRRGDVLARVAVRSTLQPTPDNASSIKAAPPEAQPRESAKNMERGRNPLRPSGVAKARGHAEPAKVRRTAPQPCPPQATPKATIPTVHVHLQGTRQLSRVKRMHL